MRFVVVEPENSIQRLFHRYLSNVEVNAFEEIKSAAMIWSNHRRKP